LSERALVSYYRPSTGTFCLYAFQRYCHVCALAHHFTPWSPSQVSKLSPYVPLGLGVRGWPLVRLRRAKVSVQLVSKICNLCDPDPPALQTDGRHAIIIARPRFALQRISR